MGSAGTLAISVSADEPLSTDDSNVHPFDSACLLFSSSPVAKFSRAGKNLNLYFLSPSFRLHSGAQARSACRTFLGQKRAKFLQV